MNARTGHVPANHTQPPPERGHKALQQQTVRDPKYDNNKDNNNNKKKNYLYFAATRFMT
jgi:hypothetical protein